MLGIWTGQPDLSHWERLVERAKNPQREVRIAMVGKYVDLTESYKSLNEALYHGGFAHRARVVIEYFDSEKLDDATVLAGVDGILVPHGFGSRGVEGKILAVRYAREQRVPYFGICYGMQLAVIEYARHVAGLERANSREIDPETPHPVIDLMPEQRGVAGEGRHDAARRLAVRAARRARARSRRTARSEISERHRHRYEFNPEYRERLARGGPRALGHLARRPARRDRRGRRPPVVPGLPVPPRVRVDAVPPAPAVRGVRGGRARARGIAVGRVKPAFKRAKRLAFRGGLGYSSRARDVSSVGRALCSHRRGHWFEPSTSHQWPGSSAG